MVALEMDWQEDKLLEQQNYDTLAVTRHGKVTDSGCINVLFYAGHVKAVGAKDAFYAFADPLRTGRKLPGGMKR